MELMLTKEEQELLKQILEERHHELRKEIFKTDHHQFKQVLKEKERLMESLMEKLGVRELAPH